MPEYIEREAVISRLKKVCVTDDVFGMGMQTGIEHAINCTKEAPTADVVEVVRCRNCMHGQYAYLNGQKIATGVTCEYDQDRISHLTIFAVMVKGKIGD